MKSPLLALLLAAAAAAETAEPAKPLAADRFRIDFFLDAEVPFVWRSEGITRVLDRKTNRASEAFLAPCLTIRAEARLPKSAEAVIEIENARLRADLFDDSTWGTEANRVIPDRAEDAAVLLRKAYLRVDDFFWDQLSVKAGLQDFALSLRGPGDAFFCDLLNSEFAMVSPVTEAAAHGSLYGEAPPAGTTPSTAGLFRDRSNAGGARLTWNAGKKSLVFVDAFFFTVLEGGVTHADERFYGVNADLLVPFTEESVSLVNVLFAGIQNDKTGSHIWTAGLGLDFALPTLPGWDFYLEAYGQFGKYAETDHGVRQRAWAGRGGIKLPLPFPGASLDGSLWCLSGDRGDPEAHTNSDFVSYENINETLVVEDALYGLDIDSNYIAGKLRFTSTFTTFNKDDFRLDLLYAYFRLFREPEQAGGPGRGDPGRRLGHEIDLRATLAFSEHASFAVFSGMLLDSQWLASHDAFDTNRRRAYVVGAQVNVGF